MGGAPSAAAYARGSRCWDQINDRRARPSVNLNPASPDVAGKNPTTGLPERSCRDASLQSADTGSMTVLDALLCDTTGPLVTADVDRRPFLV